ncbi:MAG: hypothetical protein RI942_15, partial [Pseudomonadota bacterium]
DAIDYEFRASSAAMCVIEELKKLI